jgi:hypothetical protein
MTKASWFGVFVSAAMLFGATARADDPAVSPTEWQAVIAGQIQAFRMHDAPSALSFAGDEYKKQFDDAEAFVSAIVASGYGPIVDSRSQTFGDFKLIAPDQVVQEVELTGNDQSIYEAFYVLGKETGVWRVHGVQLAKTTGLGV